MALDFDEFTLTSAERRLLKENNRNNLRHYLEGQARERRLENDLRIAGNDPGRMSPHTRAAILDEAERLGIGRQAQERERLMDHELRMLKQKNEGELAVAEQKKLGMIGQGADAAKFNGQFGLETEKERGKNSLSLAEKELEGKKELANIGLMQHELEWGKGGGRERIADIEGRSRVGAAEAQAKAQAEIQAQKNALEEQKQIAARERTKLGYARLSENEKRNVDSAANKLANEQGISFEEARSQVMASREQSQQGGDVVADATGTKWQIIRDASGKPIGKKRVQ